MLNCKENYPIHWCYPRVYDETTEELDPTNVVISYTNGTTFNATLTIQGSMYKDTGYYYCLSNETTKCSLLMESSETTQKLYVYIEDKEEFFVRDTFVNVISYQYEAAILPCQPTSPEIEVTIYKDNEEVKLGKHEGRNLVVSYDPTKGFIFDNVNTIDGGSYICKAKRRNSPEERTMFVELTIKTKEQYAMKPTINGTIPIIIREGRQLVLNCTGHAHDRNFNVIWKSPHNTELPPDKSSAPYKCRGNYNCIDRLVRISNMKIKDTGNYTCVVNSAGKSANDSRWVKVIGWNETTIKLTSQSKETIYVKNKLAKIVVYIFAPEEPNLIWRGPDDVDLESRGDKYQVTRRSDQIVLNILNLDSSDSGLYYLRGEDNAGGRREIAWLNRTLIVEDVPKVMINHGQQMLFTLKSIVNFTCKVHSTAPVDIRWYFMSCNLSKPKDCDGDKFLPRGLARKQEKFNRTYTEDFKFEIHEGILKCFASNSYGNSSDTLKIYVTDLKDSTELIQILGKPDEEVVVGDNFTLSCASTVYNTSTHPTWYKGDQKIIHTETNKTMYTFYNHLKFYNVTKNESGTYDCYSDNVDVPVYVTINVQDYERPKIIETNLGKNDLEVKLGDSIRMFCKTKGTPKPTVIWYKDGKEIDHNSSAIHFSNRNQNLTIRVVRQGNEGTYKCVASSRKNKVESQAKLTIPDTAQVSVITIIILSICLPAILIMVIMLIVKFRKEKKLQEELNLAGLAYFEKGQMDCINPELPPDEQADLLPYDRSWEFPREKLHLGKQLGAGAFGVVMKAEAWGILDHEEKTTVAVKMIRSGADRSYIKALASELKIMIHLGKHLNVVNLLGASTKNLARMELQVIVEYCRYGNLHNYLLRHRDDFVDQLDRTTGELNLALGMDKLARAQSAKSKTNLKHRLLSYTSSLAGGNHSGGSNSDVGAPLSPLSPLSAEMAPIGSDMTVVSSPTGEPDECLLSSSSDQPEWRVKYRGDYKGSGPVCSQDLFCWSFQVARGMEYLASRKVMHGDLAARNILLADNNVVKICDFGLAKSMYKSNNYRKKSSGPLPVKWMALESIRDRIFSTQSDVWSYGIVLWELFSLAQTPYPGMEADERLYNKILDGYRMQQPSYATNAIYQVMLQCWDASPGNRPSFTELVEQLGAMLDDNMRRHYEEMNNPYIDMNERNSHSDYLSMMSAPNYSNMVAPAGSRHDYVNSPGSQRKNGSQEVRPLSSDSSVFYFPGDGNTPGYLNMGGKDGIFSPGHVDDCPFDFSPNKMKEKMQGTKPSIEKFSPRPDNYVNMGQSAKTPTSFENPSYVMSHSQKT
ncbi:vascular endothelial growth factor receptor 1-like isoform X2 [Periplaneta americana]